jgi:hypothetical protein
MHNYDQFPEHAKTEEAREGAKVTRNFLSTLITDKGCTMFHEMTDAEAEKERAKFNPAHGVGVGGHDKPAPWIEDWAKKKGIKIAP